jgi:DNA-binding NtrC family response regulator
MKKIPALPILVIDDDTELLGSIERLFFSAGYNNYILCSESDKVAKILKTKEVSLVTLDLIMPQLSGQELLTMITRDFPTIPVVVVTGSDDVSTAVECMKAGAVDFVVKPLNRDHLLAVIKKALDITELKRENSSLRDTLLSGSLKNPDAFSGIITRSPAMQRIFCYMEAIADSAEPVLVQGETGVGKELLVKALHSLSGREGRLVTVDLAGLDDEMFNDTLFGHLPGAYTDAKIGRKGLAATAANGTLFLDEIGDLKLASQANLLRLIQEKEYYPLGADIQLKANARIVLATNKNLGVLIEAGKFKPDLYYRLHTHSITIPPLRDRLEDIPLLIDHFLETASREYNLPKPVAGKDVLAALTGYTYPGNIRELECIIKDAIFKSKPGILDLEAVRAKMDKRYMKETGKPTRREKQQGESGILFPARLPTLKETEELLILEALKRYDGSVTRAAQDLGISHQAVSYWKKKIERKSEGG